MIKNIIFDWSGVIDDSVENHLLVVNEIFREFGSKEITLEEMRENWVQPYMLFYNKYLPSLTHEQEEAAFKRAILKCPKSKAYSGIVELLKVFKENGIKMVILSDNLAEIISGRIKSFGLEGIFIDMVTHVYHKLESIDELVKRNNFKKEETIFIGDSNHEVEEGKNAGVLTGAVTWGYATKAKLESLKPDFLINNIEELKEAILGKI
ncbi:HAD hydrolase-like protein [Candidatus Nomurabacteria bacterium]|nr:HAD hydrolase-like protein [Candidatus Nomurabacteria bacterium]